TGKANSKQVAIVPSKKNARRPPGASASKKKRERALALPRSRSLGDLHPTIEEAVERHGEDDDDDGAKHGRRRAATKIQELKGLDVGIDAEHLSGARRSATGDGPNDIEGAERVDGADHDAHHDHRAQHRQSDVAERAPGAGGVDLGRLE